MQIAEQPRSVNFTKEGVYAAGDTINIAGATIIANPCAWLTHIPNSFKKVFDILKA